MYGKPAILKFDHVKRTFIRRHFALHTLQVTSYGGVGTTMLCRFLAKNGADMPRVTEGDWSPWKHMNHPPLDATVHDDFRAIYVIGDPRDALLSVFRRGFHHILIQRMEGRVDRWDFSWDLEAYLRQNEDYFGYHAHFKAWTQSRRKYPILTVHYDHLWDYLPDIMAFSGLPQEAIRNFPEKRDRTTSWKDAPPHIQDGLNQLFRGLVEDIDAWPAFHMLEGRA